VALLTYNGSNFDTMLGSATITATTVAVTTAGITSAGSTAPNLVNAVTGCWIWVAAAPTSGNFTVELMESGVSKALATINFANIVLGANYVRFATPYTFATLTASAYTIRVKNSAVNSGTLRIAASGLWYQMTYNLTVATPAAATDDVWVGGFNDAGLTTKTLTISGTSNAWGTGAATNIGSTTQTMGAAVTCGSGGTLKFDTSASTTLSIKGSVFTTVGGVFDMRASATKSIINTLIIDGAVTGDQGIFSGQSTVGGQFLTTGATYDIYSTYVSGLGTAASPMITGIAWDADVGDEIVIGGGTGYDKNEVRYIKTRNSSTSFVLSATPGGVESALANTHAVGSHMSNLTRNSIIKPLNTARGWFANNNTSTAISSFDYTRMEYTECASGKGIQLNPQNASTFDGVVFYNNISGGRSTITLPSNTTAQTHNGIILYNTQGTNFSAQSGIALSSSINKTLTNCFHYNAPSGVVSCGFISLGVSSTANTFTNCHSYGGNAVNSSAGYVIGLFASSGNTFNNCTVNGARQNATYLAAGDSNIFNNCTFGDKASNTNDVTALTSTLNKALFNACTFGSTTLFTNYLNQLEGSEVTFQDMDGNTTKHRWYNNHGAGWSAGAGLTDTTVRTASSLSLVVKPEDNSAGFYWETTVPQNPTSQVGIFGYVYRNATFSSGTCKVELFLDGSTVADATYTFPTTTGSWLPFNISAYNVATTTRLARVRFTGITATAGAYFFVDDLYDAGTSNKVAGLDLWYKGKPAPIVVASDYSAIPAQVWGYSDGTTSANTMGKRQVDAADNAELAAVS